MGDKTGKLVGERAKGLIDEITKEASDRWNQEKVEKQIPNSVKATVKDNILRAINRVDDFKELAFPDFQEQIKKSDKGEFGPMEKRKHSPKVAVEEIQEDPKEKKSESTHEKRTPNITQQKRAKFITIHGKKFRFDIFWRNLDDETIDRETIVTDSGVEIYINSGFKGFSLSKDSEFYCINQVAEAMAQLYLQENNQYTADKIFKLRNKLLFQVSSIILEEDEIKRLTKREEELEKLKQIKAELISRVEQSKLL